MGHNIDLQYFFCHNEACSFHKQRGVGNIIFSHIEKLGNGETRKYLRCKACNKKFAETKGTVFFKKKIKTETIQQALQSTVEGMGIRATGRVFDINKNTIINWVKQAGKQSAEHEKFF
jgi:transposase-like protein